MTHIFFSFHYSHDYHRICQVIEAWRSFPGATCTSFISDADIARMRREGLPAIHAWIEEEVAKADLTVLLLGQHGWGRYFMLYEVAETLKQGKPVCGIRIHGLPDENGQVDAPGENPLPESCRLYDWVLEDGLHALPEWVRQTLNSDGPLPPPPALPAPPSIG